MIAAESVGYSSAVEMQLIVDGTPHPISHLWEDWFMLQEPCDIPPKITGEIIVIIDSKRFTYRVFLPHGASRSSTKINYF
jgi:hypothetical protein